MNIAIFDLPFPENKDFFQLYDDNILFLLKKNIEENNHRTKVIQAHNKRMNLDKLVKIIEIEKIDVIIIHVFFYHQNFYNDYSIYLKEILKYARKVNDNIKSIVFGLPLLLCEKYFSKNIGFDYICKNNYIITIKNIVNNISQNITNTNLHDKISSSKKNITVNSWVDDNRFINISLSQGCNYSCSFCVECKVYGKWFGFHKSEVVNEIINISEYENTNLIKFGDLCFFSNSNLEENEFYINDFKNCLKSKSNKVFFIKLSTRIDSVNERILAMLKDVGVGIIFYGLESGSNIILERFNKKVNIESYIRILDLTRSSGIIPQIGFIFFDPFTTLHDIKNNISLFKKISKITFLSFVNIDKLRIFIGTRYAELFCENNKYFIQEGLTYNYDIINNDAREYYEKYKYVYEKCKSIDMYIRYNIDELCITMFNNDNNDLYALYDKIVYIYNIIIINILDKIIDMSKTDLDGLIHKYKTDIVEVLFLLNIFNDNVI